MRDNEANGGVEISTSGRYPTVNEQLDIINDALDTHLTKLSAGRWQHGQFYIHMAYVCGEASLMLYQGKTMVDAYVGQHPVVWFLDGALTPANVRDHIHASLDSKGF